MLAKALIYFAILCATIVPVRAEIIGGLNARSMDAVSIEIVSIYVVVLSKGVMPVESYTVQPGDTVEGIFRTSMGFSGSHFPVLLDAITCDLNPQICKRLIEPAEDIPPSSGGIQSLDNPLQVQATRGDWSGLRPGHELIIPSISILQRVTPRAYEKSQGETVASIIENNEVCTGGSQYVADCSAYLGFLNSGTPGFGEANFAGTIQVPSFDYLIHIPEDCEALCAAVSTPVVVDLSSNTYLDPPYRISTTATTPDSPAWDPAKWEKYFGQASACATCLDVSIDPSATGFSNFQVDHSVSLPEDVQSRYELGTGIVDSKAWTRDLVLSPFTDNFHPKQRQSLKVMDILTEMPEGPAPARQAVMIIDSRFDQLHCEFKPENFVVYDCTQFTSTSDMCVRKDPNRDYFTLAEVLPTPPLVNPDSVTPDMIEEARPRCDAAAGDPPIANPGADPDIIKTYHGTHLAGIIGAAWDGHGGGGVNPFIRLVGVEIETDFLENEEYAAWLNSRLVEIIPQEGINVVNISLGDVNPADRAGAGLALDGDDWLSDVISKFSNLVLFVVAAGNTPDPEGICQTLPACLARNHSNVAAVVGMASDGDSVLDGLNSNPAFTVGAVADDVFGTIPLNRYAEMSGSSQSAAWVSGAASLAMGYLGTGWPIRDRLIACSNIASADLENAMMGGMLDAGCLINGKTDFVVTTEREDTPLLVNVSGLRAASNLPPNATEFEFFDYAENDTVTVRWDRVVGFQRVEGGKVVLFRSKNGEDFGPLERLFGEFSGNPYMQLGADGDALAFNEVRKYVRRR